MAAIPAVSVENLHKHFGALHALKGIDFSIAQGEFFGLLGPNGAGKSTLINCLAGLVRPDSGRLSVLGHDVATEYRHTRRLLGVVPQELVYDPFLQVREALQFQAGYFGLGKENNDWIEELLITLNLADRATTNMRALSGGMKRRVLIGQALVHKPPVVVLDEPTAGVDVELRQSLWRFIKRLHAEGHTIVLTTHYLEEAENLCERIAILDHGAAIALETKSELLARGISRSLHVFASHKIETLPDQLREKVRYINGQSMVLRLRKDKDSIVSVLDTIRDAGIEVIDIQVEEDRLEDVFVQLTGERGEQGV
jgi:ABC-2 type transport system ATP-binding protein